MPLFMFLAGCTFYYSLSFKMNDVAETDVGWIKLANQYILKRGIALIVPYVSWCIIHDFCHGRYDFQFAIIRYFDNLWFLPTLFGILLIFTYIEAFMFTKVEDVSSVKKQVGMEIAYVIMAIFIVMLIFGATDIKLFRQIGIYIVPFLIGIWIKKYSSLHKLYINHLLTTVCIISFFILAPMYDMNDKSTQVLIIRFFTGLFFTQVIYCYTLSINDKVNRGSFMLEQIIYLGRNSLGIYIVHEFFRGLFHDVVFENIFIDTICYIVCSIILSYVSILIFSWGTSEKILKLLLSGKIMRR